MSDQADTLRRAAALMRARSEAATPGPWLTHEMDRIFVGNQADGRKSGLWEIVHMNGDDLADLRPEAANRNRADAEHIAAADPPFMRAVADWLDREADGLDLIDATVRLAAEIGAKHSVKHSTHDEALAVARTYLGETDA